MRVKSWLGALMSYAGGVCLALPAQAAPRGLPLTPNVAEINFRAYGLGFLPIDGRFGRLSGTLTLDDADTAFCRIEVRAETASLEMPNDDITADAQGPDLLDVARYPAFEYSGRCVGSQLDGELLLHGVKRPLTCSGFPLGPSME